MNKKLFNPWRTQRRDLLHSSSYLHETLLFLLQLLHRVLRLLFGSVSCLLLVSQIKLSRDGKTGLCLRRAGLSAVTWQWQGQQVIGRFGERGQLYCRVSPHQTPFQPVALTTVCQQLIGADGGRAGMGLHPSHWTASPRWMKAQSQCDYVN